MPFPPPDSIGLPGAAGPSREADGERSPTPSQTSRENLLRPVHVVLAIGALGFVGLLALTPVPIVDLWWQMKTGQLILEQGRVPRADPFSHTAPGAAWVAHEWLPSLLFYLLFTRVAPAALVWYKIVLAVLAFAFVMLRSWQRTERLLLSAATTVLGAMAARTFLDIRPQMLTYVLFAALLALLDEFRRRPASRLVWSVPPLMLLWANLHAGFLLGFLVLGVHLAAEGFDWLRGDRSRAPVLRALAAVIALSLPLTLLQPNGLALWQYPLELMRHDVVMGFILEWKSPDFHAAWVRPYEVFLLLMLAGCALARRSLGVADLILLVGLAHASLISIRHIPVFAITCAPILAVALGDVLGRLEAWLREHRRLPEAMGLATALSVIVLAFVSATELRAAPRHDWFAYAGVMSGFPVRACDAIDARGWGGRLFNDYKWGGYCIWRFYPRHKVFIDGRAEVYFGPAFDDYYAIHNVAPDWAARLRKWRIDTALLDRRSALARVMEASPEWLRVYEDPVAMVFRRRHPFASSDWAAMREFTARFARGAEDRREKRGRDFATSVPFPLRTSAVLCASSEAGGKYFIPRE